MELFDLIEQLRQKDDYTRADVEGLRQVLTRHPNFAEAWDFLGDIQLLCVDHDYSVEERLACYRKALDIDPSCVRVLVSLGYVYDTYLDEFNTSAHYFRKAIDLGADDDARIGLARVLAQLGKNDKATAQLDQCKDQTRADVIDLRRQIIEGLWYDPPLDADAGGDADQ